jgi:hypothetical protein
LKVKQFESEAVWKVKLSEVICLGEQEVQYLDSSMIRNTKKVSTVGPALL